MIRMRSCSHCMGHASFSGAARSVCPRSDQMFQSSHQKKSHRIRQEADGKRVSCSLRKSKEGSTNRGQGVWLNGDGGFILDVKQARKIVSTRLSQYPCTAHCQNAPACPKKQVRRRTVCPMGTGNSRLPAPTSHAKAAICHPCVSRLSTISATCLGLASSKAVLRRSRTVLVSLHGSPFLLTFDITCLLAACPIQSTNVFLTFLSPNATGCMMRTT